MKRSWKYGLYLGDKCKDINRFVSQKTVQRPYLDLAYLGGPENALLPRCGSYSTRLLRHLTWLLRNLTRLLPTLTWAYSDAALTLTLLLLGRGSYFDAALTLTLLLFEPGSYLDAALTLTLLLFGPGSYLDAALIWRQLFAIVLICK